MSTTSPPSRPTITQVARDPERDPELRPLDFRLIRRLFSYMRPYRRKRNWLLFLVLLRGIQLPSLAWVIGSVIRGPVTRGDAAGTLQGALGFAALAAATQLTFHFRQRLALELGEAAVHDLRNEVFAHLQRLPMSFYNRTKLGRVISRFTSDIGAVRQVVQNVLFVSLVGLGQMTVAAAFMLVTDWVLFLVVLALVPLLWMLNRYFRYRYSVATRASQESFSRITATMAESVSGIRVTQGFVRQEVNAGIFRQLVLDHSRYNIDVARTGGTLLPLLQVNSQFFIAGLLVIGGYRALHPGIAMPVGDLVQFFFLANMFFDPVQSLGNLYNQALMSMAGAERVFRLLDANPEWEDAPAARPLPPIRGRVEFRDLTFGYDPAKPVLHGISFVAEPGQTVALVGHTGSGKSSIINLISKFYLPTHGELYIDDVEIRQVRAESLHRQMGIVLQQSYLFTGSVLENIRFARPEATDEEVIQAARRLDCLDMIATLAEGFATKVGERGAGISLGQRQLITFIRALLADPRILILDEATSSVDSVTEARIQHALRTLLRGRTSFVVAHRLSTIRNADLVLVLDHGRIIERGTHDQLVAARGTYAGLYRQFVQATGGG